MVKAHLAMQAKVKKMQKGFWVTNIGKKILFQHKNKRCVGQVLLILWRAAERNGLKTLGFFLNSKY